MTKRESYRERPPLDPAIAGLVLIAVALFFYFAVRYFYFIPRDAR